MCEDVAVNMCINCSFFTLITPDDGLIVSVVPLTIHEEDAIII